MVKHSRRFYLATGVALLFVGVVPNVRSATAQEKTAPRPLGVVDDIALAKARSDFPALARRVIPQIAAQRKLSGIVFKSGIAWSSTGLKFVDVTPDVLSKVRLLPVQPQTLGLSAEQKEATDKAVLALTQLKSATAIGVSFDDYSSRLINAQSVVETSLMVIPGGPLHDAIERTLQTYIASLQTWRDIRTLQPLRDKKVEMQRALDDRLPRTETEKLDLGFKRQHEDEEREKEEFQPLYDKWNEAEEQLAAVVTLLAPKK